MTIYFITRHPGARDWAAQQGIAVDRQLAHLDPCDVRPGDRVLGVLPVHLAAEVCQRGGRYFHLSLEIPPERRGTELGAAEMQAYGARLAEYRVERLRSDEA